MKTISKSIFSDNPEIEYSSLIPYKERKEIGQFFTPYRIAEFMSEWIISSETCKTILDPAVGLGVFFRAIASKKRSGKYRFVGYDIDEDILNRARDIFKNIPDIKANFKKMDYLLNDWGNQYDGIICNPPYLKFHDYESRRILAVFEKKLKMRLTGFTNIYTLFFLKSMNQLSEGGRAAYIVPSEFLNADYGKKVKEYLIKSEKLRLIIIVDFQTNVFNGAITTSCILLFSNDKYNTDVEFINVKSINDLKQLQDYIKSYPIYKKKRVVIKSSQLNPEQKWRKYYGEINGDKYKNLVSLNTYAKVVRGIATGANDYFSFSIGEIRQFNIDKEYLLPCLTKANYARTHFFTTDHFNELKDKDKPVFLLNAVDLDDNNVVEYLKIGERRGIDKKYLTSHRNPWYAIENRSPAPILVTVFSRNGLRFIRNEAKVYNLTSFHCVYVYPLFIQNVDLLMAYFLTDISREIFNDEKREYGDGLDKFEPNDLNNAKIVNLDIINQKTKSKILEYYRVYRRKEISSKDTTEVKEKLNEVFHEILRK